MHAFRPSAKQEGFNPPKGPVVHSKMYRLGMAPEPILPIRRIRRLLRAPETPGGPLALKDVLILVSILNLASCCENMNDHLF